MNLLDKIMEATLEGREVRLIIAVEPCQNPEMGPGTSYRHGCRCNRCAHFIRDQRSGRLKPPGYTQESRWTR